MSVLEDLTEEEAYLWAILHDMSGVDQAEWLFYDPTAKTTDSIFRLWPFQWKWYHSDEMQQIDQCGRAVGKSQSIRIRGFAFPFIHPNSEMLVTAPELVHLEPITRLIEMQIQNVRLSREMLPRGRSAITHRPFEIDFLNGARIVGRIPQRDGKGVKGCLKEGELILTDRGYRKVEDLAVGDLVLTAKGRWRPITFIEEDYNDCYEVTGQGSHPIIVSCDHRFLGAENMAGPKQKRRFEESSWHMVEFLLEHKVYWATPTAFEELPIPDLEFAGTSTRFDTKSDEFWWLVGRYLADGYLCESRMNGKERRVSWVAIPEVRDDFVVRFERLGLSYQVKERDHSSADILQVCSAPWQRWLQRHFGEHANEKILPGFVLGMPESFRENLLAGYLAGDGSKTDKRPRVTASSASKPLILGIQMLAQSLGYSVNCSGVQPKVTEICGTVLKSEPLYSWRIQIQHGHAVQIDDHLHAKVKKVVPVGKHRVFNPIVEEDHSYISNSIVSHNAHPLWLELDEGQDYPEAGWMELIETLNRAQEGAIWRAHGVTRGVRDYFYKFTQPDSGWNVHRYTAMHKPTWTDQERKEKIESYGSKDSPDYRRNILGLHGDATNPLFVLHRLMAATDTDESSDYNILEYKSIRINAERLLDVGGAYEMPLAELPRIRHADDIGYWLGADIGYTNHPTEILAFVERRAKTNTYLQLMSRVHLERVSHGDQVRIMLWLINFYEAQAFSMDRTGLGLPLFQDIQEHVPEMAHRIKGYNFSSKILVDFDSTVVVDPYTGDKVKDSGIERNVLEHASDVLRGLVDAERVLLPWDKELIREFQGQTWTSDKSGMDLYGRRRIYSQGSFHALDAARMAVLGWSQHSIEESLRHDQRGDVLDVFGW